MKKRSLGLGFVLSVGMLFPAVAVAAVGEVFNGTPFFDDGNASQNLNYRILSEPSETNGLGQVELIRVEGVRYSDPEYTIPGWVKRSGAPAGDLPYIVVSIGGEVFQNSTTLQSITIEKGVTRIEISAFRDCTSLQSVTLPEDLTTIGMNAFYGCTSLQSINLPEGVTTIGANAFQGCISLQSIMIPEGVTTIGSSAFRDCTSLQSITIPEGVTTIGANAFYDCTSLQSVTLPESVTRIEGSAFRNCTSLQSVTLPEGVTRIEGSAFRDCTSLQSINLPESVTRIESSTFCGCTNLQSITLPEGVTTIEGSAFYGCTSLQNINLPESLTTIGGDAFYDCSQLKEITLPNGVTSIGSWAFGGCSSLRSVVIPESVTLIDEYAFRACSNLATVTIMVEDDGEPTIGTNAFPEETTVNYDYRLGSPEITVDEASQTISWTEGSTRADAYDITFFNEAGQQVANVQKISDNSIHYATASALAFASNGNYYCTVRARDDIKLIGDKDYRPSDATCSDLFLYVSFDKNGFAALPEDLGRDDLATTLKLNVVARTIEVPVGEHQTVSVPLKAELVVGGTALAPTYTAQLVFANLRMAPAIRVPPKTWGSPHRGKRLTLG